jgi:hypothetical protein
MKTKNFIHYGLFTLALLIGTAGPAPAWVSTNYFTYQGLLTDAGLLANGRYDMRWTFFSAETGGTALGNTVTTSNILVANGLFTVDLPLQELSPQPNPPGRWNLIDDEPVWIGIEQRRTGSQENFQPMLPRQKLLFAPRAVCARLAGTALTVPSGAIASSNLAPGAAAANLMVMTSPGLDWLTESNEAVLNLRLLAGPGMAVEPVGKYVSISALRSCFDYTNCYWSLLGNGNAAPPNHFLGTINNVALELKVNRQRALRLEPHALSPNLIGGQAANLVASGIYGASIGGGGVANSPNVIDAIFGTIGGGSDNWIKRWSDYGVIDGGLKNIIETNSPWSTIGGGDENLIEWWSPQATISGGRLNWIQWDSPAATIGGGMSNLIWQSLSATLSGGQNSYLKESPHATVGGGLRNWIQASRAGTIAGGENNKINWPILVVNPVNHATIGGGLGNFIDFEAHAATIAGGSDNSIWRQSPNATISGGRGNSIAQEGRNSTISGGISNTMDFTCDHSTIGGGMANFIGDHARYSTIAGGVWNTIKRLSDRSAIGGGHINTIEEGSHSSTIAGGSYNHIWENATNSTISGGAQNLIWSNSFSSTIGGGRFNDILSNSPYAVIGGGYSNKVSSLARSATIAGGSANAIEFNGDYAGIGAGSENLISNAWYSTVSGGQANAIWAFADYSSIGGGRGNRMEGGAVHATIGGGYQNTIKSTADYATIPGGSRAMATNYGQMAYASGAFSADGDAQSSLFVLRRSTANATTTPLYLDGGAASERMRIPADATWAFDILIIARTAGGDSAGYHIRGTIENNAGVVALAGAPAKTVLNEDDATWDANVVADNINDALVINVNGDATDTVRWVAKVRTVEVTFP